MKTPTRGVGADATTSGFLLPRHPGDAVRVVVAAAIVAATAPLVHRDHVAVLEVDVFRVANDLPAWLFPFLWPVMQAGNIVAVPVVASVVAATRRFRLAVEILLAGTGVWILAKVVKTIIVRDRPTALLEGVHVHGAAAAGRGYLSGHAAVLAAIVTLIIPYLSRRTRRLAASCLVIVGVARMYVGAHLPLDVIAGAALGWGVASAVHLALGAPSGRPTVRDVDRLLRDLGLVPAAIRAVGLDARRSALFDVALDGGRRAFVKVIPRERRDRDLLYRMWNYPRRVASRSGPARTARGELEHEALVALLAARAGVRVAPVLAVGGYRHGAGGLAYEWVEGRPLDEAVRAPDASGAAVLVDAWRQLAALHAAGIVHNDLAADDLLVDTGGRVHVLGLGAAATTSDPHLFVADAADLLVIGAAAAGAPAALGAASEYGDPVRVTDAIDLLASDRAVRKRARELLAASPHGAELDDLVRSGRQMYSSAARRAAS